MTVRFFSFDQANIKSKPVEDSYYHVGFGGTHAFAVGDGISRTCYGIEGIPSSLPAAEAFCRVSATALVGGKSLRESFMRANAEIALVNKRAGITSRTMDYLERDYICCVGIAGVITEDHPHIFRYGYMGDCGVLAYQQCGRPVFLSDNPVAALERFRDEWGCENKTQETLLWRQHFRNHPGRLCGASFGALTGEEFAMRYLMTGKIRCVLGEVIMLFSDGIYPFLFDRRFRAMVSDLLQDDETTDASKQTVVANYITGAMHKLQQKGVANLNDDKTFMALTMT
ncbi:MAG: hypothetical protein Q8R30_03570 [bacterium]|nr:hypothetical protein [bacterium]MDZ4285981.1 hypothetical protein [Candidatus Sungbacteria bacterium]